jgi:hypothetical protein
MSKAKARSRQGAAALRTTMTEGNTMANSDARSTSYEDLRKRAQQLDIPGRSRMKKAELADAVAHKEAEQAAAQREVEAAQERAPAAVREAAQREVEAAQQRAPAAVREAAEDAAQTTAQPRRASRGGLLKGLQQASTGLGNTGRTILIAVITALLTSLATATLANDYYTSRIGDWAFRRGTPAVSTEVTLERESRVQGLTWVFPEGLGDLSISESLVLSKAAASPDDFNQWARVKGGVDVDASFVKLIVEGQRQAGVVITGMQAKIDRRGPPLRGVLFYAPPEGERENVQIGFNLDERVAVARLINSKKSLGDPGYFEEEYFKNYNIPLKLGEDQVFTVVATTSSYYYAWYIEIEVQAGGRRHYIRIDRRQKGAPQPYPFEISARADPRDDKKGTFSVYKELYVLRRSPLNSSADPLGFTSVDPKTYEP